MGAMPLPSLQLVVLCPKSAPPSQVAGVRLWFTPGAEQLRPELTTSWADVPERCLQGYAVWKEGDKPERINEDLTLYTSFTQILPDASKPSGCFSVSAIDFWGQSGPRS